MVAGSTASRHAAPVTPAARRGASDVVIALVLALIGAGVYLNVVRGEFVYDDTKQILRNQLIQEDRFFWKALTSDVWAFKGTREEAWSNYWRPTFVLWLIINHRLFGVGSPVGWHVTNMLLHASVCVLAYALVRRLRAGAAVAAAIVLLFAVHPAHVESVAWISGSPDLLMSAPLLGALLCVLRAARFSAEHAGAPDQSSRARAQRHSAPVTTPIMLLTACVLHGIALMAKEVAVLFPLIVFAAVFSVSGEFERGAARQSRNVARVRRALVYALPFALTAAAFLLIRTRILEMVELKPPWHGGPMRILLTAPLLLAFYLRQCVFPMWIGPSYPLRAVAADNLGFGNFWLPLGVVAVSFVLLVLLARRDPLRRIGLVLLVLPLAPAMNINAFTPEQLVHDRYLYLPLLGFLMVVIPALAGAFRRIAAARAERVALALCILFAAPLTAQTLRYNTAWTREIGLWAWSVESDPTSATNRAEYGRCLMAEGRLDEARAQLDRAIAIQPVTDAVLNRALLAVRQRRYEEAVADLKLVLASYPEHILANRNLATCYERLSRPDLALQTLQEARSHPKNAYARCALTEAVAVALYQNGRKGEALRELEAVRGDVPHELGPDAPMVLYRLGHLYREINDNTRAVGAFEEYLLLTALSRDESTRARRAEAMMMLARLYNDAGNIADARTMLQRIVNETGGATDDASRAVRHQAETVLRRLEGT
ncbi:MAG: tetratricopeptide repeat protein [Phycisphaerae bacterium]|nr:tetratricopeptide repeat protein [Phycisphaerae bacterium]NUQ47148.1 tetratricopeptide repeat protein [Phycisphaerae bacterium]